MRATIALIVCCFVAAGSAAARSSPRLVARHFSAQSQPVILHSLSAPPKSAFSYGGTLRAYYFTRTNFKQNKSNPNRMAFNFGVRLHAEYHFGQSPWTASAAYYGADPFGLNGANPGFNSAIDNTLAGFSLSTLGEAYLQFKNAALLARAGNLALNTPWAPASDSRIKPALYQGFDGAWSVTKHWTLGFDRITKFEHRTSSLFDRRTLLTDKPAGNPAYPIFLTPGFLMASLGYRNGTQFAATAYDYEFYELANLFYLDSKWTWDPSSKLKPFVGLQFIREVQTGASLIGVINNKTLGTQLGGSLRKNVDAALSWDSAPWRSATLAGKCSAVGIIYFAPAGGTAACVGHSHGTATVYYGGMASPYSEAYATDPLYTTSISQGMVDRHSAGDAYKLATTVQTMDKRVKLILSEAYYYYGNNGGPNQTREFNADMTFYMSKVSASPYHGLSLRHRYADRRQPTLPFDFKYNRTQLQYDF